MLSVAVAPRSVPYVYTHGDAHAGEEPTELYAEFLEYGRCGDIAQAPQAPLGRHGRKR